MRRLVPALLLVALPVWGIVGCGGESGGHPVATAPPGYVDDAVCADCHGDLARSYQGVGMARSFYPASAAFLAGDATPATFFHAPSQRHYETFVRDGWLHIRRYQLDGAGRRRNVFEQRMDWVIGSGNHVRSYAFATASGELFAAPINYYTAEQAWAMAPGYDFADHFGFSRPIPRACMFCHNAYPPGDPHAEGFGTRDTFPRTLPHGLGCQRCHGPGGAHVELASSHADDARIRNAIGNPARLPIAQRDDVCLQCHLQPTAKLESRQIRFGRGVFSFRPDQPLGDYQVALEFDSPGDDAPAQRFEINHHPYRLRQSRCFTESKGQLLCTTCHDPHRKPQGDAALEHYRQKCATCHALDADAHATAHGAANPSDCVGCHMPTRRPHDVTHTLVTDHKIQRRPDGEPRAPRTETPKPQQATPRLYGSDHGLSGEEAALYLAHARVRGGELAAIAELSAALARTPTSDAEPHLTLAHAQHARGLAPAAEATLRAVLERDAHCTAALVALGSLRSLGGDQADAALLLQRALELDPDSPDAHHELAETLRLGGKPTQALVHAQAATRLRPVLAAAWLTLGRIQLALDHRPDARASLTRASAIEPGDSGAYEALAILEAQDGDPAAAEDTLRFGASIALKPHRLTVGLVQSLLLGHGGAEIALAEGLRVAAAAARADDPEVSLLLALALLLTDRAQEALLQADVAERAGTDASSCALLRAVACAALGRPEVALAHAARAQATQATTPTLAPVRRALEDAARAALR